MTSKVTAIRFSDRGEGNGPKIIPERLLEARKAIAITQTELAEKVGVSRQLISAFEQGVKQPGNISMHKIASVLDQPIGYFISSNAEFEFGPLSARTYRAFGPTTHRRNDQCDVVARWCTRIAAYLSKKINFPEPVIPDLDDMNIKGMEDIDDIADSVRTEWGLGLGPIGNLTKLLESKGIFIVSVPINTAKVNAFSFWAGGIPFIILGSDDNTTCVRRRFDLAHELGHLVLHRGVGDEELKDKKTLDNIEREANRFAGAFLLPQRSYPNEIFSSKLETFVDLKARWKVAIAAQVYRCSDLKIFTSEQTLNLRKQISYRKWRTKEPLDDVLELETPVMLKGAAKMITNAGLLSPQAIYADINLNASILERVTGIAKSDFIGDMDDSSPVLELKPAPAE